MNKEKIYLFILLLSLSTVSIAQREANIWYFGIHAGIDFNSGVAIPLTDGALSRWEGVATFSNNIGNLLFYTDGDTVWNAQHEAMPNGYNLNGHPSSTESAIIVPYPQNDSLFYIFTVDYEGNENGLCYSVVNMNLDNGRGDITDEKNIQLETPIVEKVTAVRHENNEDVWVISHGWETDSFFVYRVTPAGLNPTPHIYEIGTKHRDIGVHGNNAVGYMRVSPNGEKIALALQVDMIFEVFDFNDATGEISNHLIIPDTADAPYGVEFSPDASKLYLTSRFYLHQVDLEAGTPADIINSYTLIDSSLTENFFGAIQLATDGKIYLAHDFSEYLGVISNPTESPENCNFELDGFYLDGKICRMGLPNFIQTYFLPPDFLVENYCFGDSTLFTIPDITNLDSVLWNFDDPTTGTENTSKLFSPKHLFSAPDFYNVNLTMYRLGIPYEKNRIIQINSLPEIELGNDTTICIGDTLVLNAEQPKMNYLWNNNSTDSVLNVSATGTYWVRVTNIYTQCSNSDTIDVLVMPLPDFSLGNDTSFCLNDSLIITVSYPKASFLWNTGSVDSSLTVYDVGNYWLEITDSVGCVNRDSIIFQNYPLPIFDLGNDTILCENTTILLQINQEGEYLWNDNSTNNNLTVTKSGTYWLIFMDTLTCENSDTIIISSKFKPAFTLGNDSLLCEGEDLLLKIGIENVEFLWHDETTENEFYITEEGDYWCTVTNVCGSLTDTISITYEYCGEIYIPNIITPNNDGINDAFRIKGIEGEPWRLQIFNRWGKLVFETDDYKNNWRGKNHPSGVYYYILSNKIFKIQYTGFVHKHP